MIDRTPAPLPPPSRPGGEVVPGPRGFARLSRAVAEQVAGRRWWVRAPLLLALAGILRGYLRDPLAGSIFSGVNLGFHEMGHAALFWSGSTVLTAAGGTLFELGIPIAAAFYLLRAQRDLFGAAVCLFWLGSALVGVGVYAADALVQQLPLVSPFGPVDVDSHDWTFILLKYGRLSQADAIGAQFQRAGLTAMASSLAIGVWLLYLMSRPPNRRQPRGEAPSNIR